MMSLITKLALLCLCTIAAAKESSSTEVENTLHHLNEHFQRTMCTAILALHCARHVITENVEVIGSDMVNYTNHCVFAQERCKASSTLKLCHKGSCLPLDGHAHSPLQRRSSASSIHKNKPDQTYIFIKDVFCKNMHQIHCGNIVDADICGTDGFVYKNRCLFAKVKCFKPLLDITNPEDCSEHGLPLRTTPGSSIIG